MLKKFLIGTFVVAIMFVGAFALTQKASAAPQAIVTVADIQYAATVRQGSSGQAALIWQRFLNGYSITANLVEDGAFGPLSATQARAWQSSKGLVADAVLGPMSRAVAMAQIQSGSPASAYPAGCTSTVGYSSVTGFPCSTITALPAGCSTTAGFSPTTGALCSGSVSTLPAGCSTTAGFSPTTGASCSGGSVSSNTGPLAGGAGDINVTPTSTDVETTVTEGTSNVKVLGFKVEAIDSDVAITNLKVNLDNVDTSGTSTRLDRYAGTVSIYMDGTKVGSADVADFTKETVAGVTNSVYSKSIALSNAVVRQGTSNKATFYVTVSALDTIDSTNMLDANWAVKVDNLRFQDATGVVMTTSDSVGSLTLGKFDFSSLSSSGTVKVAVTEGLSNPIAQGVPVSDTSSTKNVLMLEMKVKATGSPISFDTLKITPTNTVGSITAIVGELQLSDGSNTLATIDGQSLVSGQLATFNLDSTYTIPADTTRTFDIYATINSEKNFLSGGNLQVDFAKAGMSPEDSNGDLVTGSNYTVSVPGSLQSFAITGAAVTYISDFFQAEQKVSPVADGTISINFTVSAFGSNDVTIKEDQFTGDTHTAGSLSHALAATFVGYTLTGAVTTGGMITSTDITRNNSLNYVVPAGTTRHLTLSLKFNTTSGFVRLAVNSVDGSPVTNIQTGAH